MNVLFVSSCPAGSYCGNNAAKVTFGAGVKLTVETREFFYYLIFKLSTARKRFAVFHHRKTFQTNHFSPKLKHAMSQ